MSSKKARRELLRVLVLAALLSTPYMGVGAEDTNEDPYPIKGDTISGNHDLQGRKSLFDFKSADEDDDVVFVQNVTATNDVSVTSEWKRVIGSGYIFNGSVSSGKLDLNMNDHSLSIDSGPDIFFLEHSDTQVNIHDADTIKATARAGVIMDIFGSSGSSVNLQAQNDIQLIQAVQQDWLASLTVGGDNQLTLKAGQDIVLQNDASTPMMGISRGATAEMNAGRDITFNKGNIGLWSRGSLKMDASNNITFNKDKIEVWSKSALTVNAVNDIELKHDGPAMDIRTGGELQMDAGHDIMFNNTNSESDVPTLNAASMDANVTLTAKNDILFNRVKDGTFIDLGNIMNTKTSGPASVTATAKENIIFHEEQISNSPAIEMTNGSSLQIKAQTIKGNTQRLADEYLSSYGYNKLSLTADEIEWIAQGQEVEPSRRIDNTSMVVASNGEIDFDAKRTLKLSTEITPTLVHAFSGDVTMHAGDLIYLHNTGSDSRYWAQANLWADDGTIDLTTDGLISVDNKGAVAAQAAGSGKINFNGNTIIPEAGIGAKSENGGKINFNGETVMTKVDIGAWAQTDFGDEDYESAEMDFNGPRTIDQAESRTVAKMAMRQAYDDDYWDELDDESDYEDDYDYISKITFDGPLTITHAETGAVAKLDSDIIFNDGLKIQAEGDAFYTKLAGRIQALASGVDKVIKGNMRAYNGQIDALFDTPDSSFTGFTELRDIDKVYSSNEDEEEYPDEGTCPAEPEPGDCGGCEDPVIDEGSHINITLRNGAFWDVTGDSTLTKLDNGSLVNMSDAAHTGTSITAKTLSGTGTMVMDLDWTSNGGAKEKTEHSDYIVATESATGTQTIVSDQDTMHLDEMGIDDRLYFATLTNSDAVFTSPITQQNVQKGSLYDYTIGLTSETTAATDTADVASTVSDREATDTTTDWFFGTVGYTESPLVETGRINSQIMYDLVTDVDTLNKRMGDVRHMNTDPDGWWARTTYTHQDRDSYSGHSNRFELGKDFVMNRADGSTIHQGAVFTYLRGKDSFTTGNGKYNRYSGALYHTWLGNQGQYVDVVGRIGKVMGNSHTFLINGDQSDSSFGTWYQQASVETGRSYDLKDGWYFEPQAQLQYTHMNSKSYTSSDGINHDLDSVNSFIGRLGFRLGRTLDEKTSWYLKGDILHEFSGDGGILLTSSNGLERINYSRDGKDTWYDLGAGLTTELSPSSSLWFEFERKFSGTYSNDWEFNGGISWKF